jgi:carbamoyl-phosphate synthase large subunit
MPSVYVLEVNPRASRTVPFVSARPPASSWPRSRRAAWPARSWPSRAAERPAAAEVIPPYFSVKEAVFPFNKFPGVDPILGPEMRSTGEVMGVGRTFGEAMLKSQLGAGSRLPPRARCASPSRTATRRAPWPWRATCTRWASGGGHQGHGRGHRRGGVPVKVVNKVKDGRPHIVDMVKAGEIQLVFTTVDETRTAIADSRHIRQAALANRSPTTPPWPAARPPPRR